MTVWCQILVLLCCMLNLVESSTPSQVLQRNKYHNSFRLARSTRTRIQLLQKKYKEEKWWHKHFEDRGRPVNGLPSLSTDFYSWLSLTDWDRLHAAFRDLQVYWTRLERKRKELEMEEKEKLAGQAARPTLSERIMHIQLDLRDLMSKVSFQMRHMRSSWTKPTSLPHLDPETSPRREWDSRPEGYIILRELDLYLTKLARDFLLLASKPPMTQQ